MKRALAALLLVAVAGCGVSPAEEARREYQQGRDALLRDDITDALQHLDASLAILPNADAYAERAACHIIRENWELADSDVQKALSMDSKHKRAVHLKGLLKEETDRINNR